MPSPRSPAGHPPREACCPLGPWPDATRRRDSPVVAVTTRAHDPEKMPVPSTGTVGQRSRLPSLSQCIRPSDFAGSSLPPTIGPCADHRLPQPSIDSKVAGPDHLGARSSTTILYPHRRNDGVKTFVAALRGVAGSPGPQLLWTRSERTSGAREPLFMNSASNRGSEPGIVFEVE